MRVPTRPSLGSDDLEALKVSIVILSNLADKNKRIQSKYRQLRLSNKKIKKLLACPLAARYLKEVGFTEDEEGQSLRVSESAVTSIKGEEHVPR